MFSGPVFTTSAVASEIKGILFVIKCLILRYLVHKRTVICSDSVQAVNTINKGLHHEFPLLIPKFQFQHLINYKIFVHFVPRQLNENADSLAKKGVSRPFMAARWNDLACFARCLL